MVPITKDFLDVDYISVVFKKKLKVVMIEWLSLHEFTSKVKAKITISEFET